MKANGTNGFFTKRPTNKSALGAVALAASAALTSGTAMAAVICNAAPVAIVVPQTTAGVYINLVTGAAGTPAQAPGWDFNPWGSSALQFFTNAAAGSRYVGTGTVISVLAAGTPIDATSTLTPVGTTTGGGFLAGVTDGYLGIRFLDQASAIRYGWVRLTTTAPAGHPATITGYCYQDDGTGITAGTTPVSLQSYSVD